uniref:Uncharacterized protein n=1 Tax=viral metagenome TaxID=1070528 RepID=A0A6C0ATB8_9ZZZZ
MDFPKLIDYSTRNYLFQTLNHCHEYRVNLYYYALNIGVFALFVLIVSAILYHCYKNKLTDYEREQRNLRDQDYILSKIRFYQVQSKANSEGKMTGITNLPFTES